MRRPTARLISREGWLFMLGSILLCIVALRIGSVTLGIISLALLIFFILIFRDPPREIPSVPLAVLSPVDGRVLAVEYTDKGALERESTRITIRVDNFGAYTARSPVEGKVLNLQDNYSAGSRLTGVSGLWIRTDENDDVVVLMNAPRPFRPKSFIGYGERLGQGQPYGFIRLTRRVQVFIPLNSSSKVAAGDYVRAGNDILARLIHD
ncbi:MAG: hypothetical protein OER80_05415 [Gammaproteobacteria bacterium]|nr:hypothetical protein [Gammaproteobacteria bacterium]MDH3767925.1 hypothetical protein [Gammaproteobacteria bacterium]